MVDSQKPIRLHPSSLQVDSFHEAPTSRRQAGQGPYQKIISYWILRNRLFCFVRKSRILTKKLKPRFFHLETRFFTIKPVFLALMTKLTNIFLTRRTRTPVHSYLRHSLRAAGKNLFLLGD